ncbi:hypothetical protein DL764_002101 [Monosporascus ibericus]|uniref:DUF3835 domain-containing protein n=1 Tax=Monosporascus ibericus TaxID=155417 RepID=A0A4Q4TN62_9PEZI|nr:hypothetical protein DL764_002101 [Monosporascus ibericus]
MAAAKDSFANLERHVRLLEENVEKLSSALNHWRQWKEEYETLQEDVKALPQPASREDLARVREEYEGELIRDKELVEIFGTNDSKKPDQIKSTLTNRLGYVAKNIQTLEKQLETARNKLAAASIVSNPDAATDDDGLPITEIVEELDDDDNVVSYSLRTPGGKDQAKLLETLEKMGIKEEDIPEGDSESSSDAVSKPDAPASKDAQKKKSPSPPSQPAHSGMAQKSQMEEPQKTKTVARKKSVTFAEDTKPGDVKEDQSETSKRLVEILRKARDEQGTIEDAVMPADEPPEDAALREDMIRYNKETMEFEMAPIVAELNLEEGSDIDTDEYSDFYDDDDDDDEDQWGKSTKPVVDDDWKRQMLELKERLSKHKFGVDEAGDEDDSSSDTGEGIGRITIRREEPASSERPASEPKAQDVAPPSDAKKGVRFAPTLDIADEPAVKSAPAPAKAQAKPINKAVVEPLSHVMERTGVAVQPTQKSNKKPSRFRMERKNGTSSVGSAPTFHGTPIAPERPTDEGNFAPSGPEGRTLAASVLEHEPSMEAREPDEFDASLLQQQVAEEYHKMRNKFVYQQGGFLKDDERPVRPLDEEEGGPRRVSRFKAARLARS